MEKTLKILDLETETETKLILNQRVKQIRRWTLETPHTSYDIFGFDPGTTHLGIAHHFGSQTALFQVDLERSKNPIERMEDVGFLLCYLCEPRISSVWDLKVVIEGAGFESSQYRQVELAECRTTIALWFKTRKVQSIVLPAPNHIRKVVFGDGKMKAHNYWTESEIPPDALAALSCVYYVEEMHET